MLGIFENINIFVIRRTKFLVTNFPANESKVFKLLVIVQLYLKAATVFRFMPLALLHTAVVIVCTVCFVMKTWLYLFGMFVCVSDYSE